MMKTSDAQVLARQQIAMARSQLDAFQQQSPAGFTKNTALQSVILTLKFGLQSYLQSLLATSDTLYGIDILRLDLSGSLRQDSFRHKALTGNAEKGSVRQTNFANG